MPESLICPRTGSTSFGEMPSLVLDGQTHLSAPIHLLDGRHFGPNSGFGAQHIWAEHQKEMAQAGFNSYEEVPNFVQRIVAPHTQFTLKGAVSSRHASLLPKAVPGLQFLNGEKGVKVRSGRW